MSHLDFMICREISRKVINKIFHEEIESFPYIWEILEKYLIKWKDIEPKNWPLAAPDVTLSKHLGFSKIFETNMTAPKISAMTTGVLWHIGKLESKPEERDIERIIDICSVTFNVSYSLTKNLKKFLVPLCMKELSKIYKEPKLDKIEIEIFLRGESIKFNRKKIKELKERKSQYDIWLYKTCEFGERDEILINQKTANCGDMSIKLLICFLKRTGNLCGYRRMFKEVWNEEKRVSRSIERRKIVQAKRKLAEFKIIDDNITPISGKGYKVGEGIRNHCLIFSTELYTK